MTSIEELEKKITSFLQRTVQFSLETKSLKKGKLILFCVKDFFCTFTLLCEEKNNKKIIYEIPYPFKTHYYDNKLVFDYTIKTFCNGNENLEQSIKKILPEKPSKLLNKRVSITVL
jgi:hypothetical protein